MLGVCRLDVCGPGVWRNEGSAYVIVCGADEMAERSSRLAVAGAEIGPGFEFAGEAMAM